VGRKRALVTGVAGFIGSHVAAHCSALGFQVTGIDDLSGGFLENIPEGVDFRQGSVVDSE
jgi:UDP-glucose 4-epimerase